MVDERERIYIDSDCDVHDTLDDLRDAMDDDRAEWTRYVREDLCVESGENDIILKHLPLFGCHVDSEGDVWVKIPVKVKSNE